VTASGNAGGQGIVLLRTLFEPESGTVLAEIENVFDILPEETVGFSEAFSLAGNSPREYAVRLQAAYDGAVFDLDERRFRIVDVQPPALSVIVPAANTYHAGEVPISVSVRDDLSGVGEVQYRIDDGAWGAMAAVSGDTYASRWLASAEDEGPHTVEVRARDGAGNLSAPVSVAFTIDLTAPVIAVSGVDDGGLYNGAVTPVVTVTDSSPVTVRVELDGSAFESGAAVSSEGIHALSVHAEDLAGNVAEVTVAFALDLTVPTSSVESAPPSHADGSVQIFVAAATPLSITGSDLPADIGGIAILEYRLDTAQAWTVFSTPFTLEGMPDRPVAVVHRATDRAGNVEPDNTTTFVLDTTAPTTAIAIGDPHLEKDGNPLVVPDTRFTLESVDTGAGLARIEYRKGAGPWAEYVDSFAVADLGLQSIEYRGIDNVGNSIVVPIIPIGVPGNFTTGAFYHQAGTHIGTMCQSLISVGL